MNIKERLKRYIDSKGLTITEFEKVVELGRGRVSNIKSLGSDILGRIKKEYPDIDLTWLITGNSEISVSAQKTKQTKPQKKTEFQQLEEKVEKALENIGKRMEKLERDNNSERGKKHSRSTSGKTTQKIRKSA